MKPTTKLEKEVFELAKLLKPVTEKQIVWGQENCLDKNAVVTKEKAYCLDCGGTWKHKGTLAIGGKQGSEKPVKCPCCGNKLMVLQSKKRTFTDGAYYGILTTFKGYQLFRIFSMRKSCKAGQPAKYFSEEIMQHWVHRTGRVFLFSGTTFPMYDSQYIVPGSALELKRNTWTAYQKLSTNPYKIHPDRRYIPELKRNGFKGHFHGIAPTALFYKLLADPEAETLLKTGQQRLFKYVLSHSFKKNVLREKGVWNSVKICTRNKYIVQDSHSWVDYVQLLIEFNKDASNSHYVCPVDLRAVHDKLVRKKRDKMRKLQIEEQRKRLEDSQKSYEELKGKFFGLSFSQGEITVKVLESVEEIMKEGDELRHCVFTNEYHKKSESLLLSARIGEKPVETIEVSLQSLKIIQARGFKNDPSHYHKQVVDLVTQHLPVIGKVLRSSEGGGR